MKFLAGHGEEGESFKRILENCSLRPTNLVYHLKVLAKKGLIEKDFVYEAGRRDYTRYRLTKKGRETWSTTDILSMGSGSISDSGVHGTGYPNVIKVIPMELGPKLLKINEVR